MEGTFEGRNATLNITKADSEGLKATIHVQYTNLTDETLTGTVNTVTNTIHLTMYTRTVLSTGSITVRSPAMEWMLLKVLMRIIRPRNK